MTYVTHNLAETYHLGLLVVATVLPDKSDSYVMLCLQSYQGLRIERSLVY